MPTLKTGLDVCVFHDPEKAEDGRRARRRGRCNANAQNGLDVCVFHDPEKAEDGRRARRAGGIKGGRRAAVLPPDTPDHPLANTKDVSILLADSINQLRRGQLDPRVANSVGYLASVLLRSLEQGPMEERMARLEAILGIAVTAQTPISGKDPYGPKPTKSN